MLPNALSNHPSGQAALIGVRGRRLTELVPPAPKPPCPAVPTPYVGSGALSADASRRLMRFLSELIMAAYFSASFRFFS